MMEKERKVKMLELLITWLIEVVRTLPVASIQTIVISTILNILKYIYYKINHVQFDTIKLRNSFDTIRFKRSKELEDKDKKYYFIESPKNDEPTPISSTTKRNSKKDMNDDPFIFLILSIVISSIISGFFIEHVVTIANILKLSSVIPIYLCFILIGKIILTNKVQKITIKYIVYTLFVSALTLYYGSNLVELSKIMTSSTENLKLLGESIQIIVGVGLAFFQQLVSYIMLVRVILVFIYYRKAKESKALNKLLFKTEFFEHIPLLVVLTLFISAISIYFTKILYS